MILKDGERLDYVNDNLSLIQNKEGLTFGTDALLLAGYCSGKKKFGIELGGGSGIISMLLLTRKKIDRCICLEIQPEYADLISRNAEFNNLGDRLDTVCTDIRDYTCEVECDLVYSNPPYMKRDSGRPNESDKKNIARHEVFGGINDFCLAAKRLLKYGGSFLLVYRPDRMCDLIASLRENNLEPKRITFVHADKNSAPSMMLLEAKKGGKSGLKLTRPLIIYTDEGHKEYSEDMEFILKEGVFPPYFDK